MTILKRIISALPGGATLARKHSYWRRSRTLQKIGDTKARFTNIYHQNKWKNSESRSGVGSTIVATESIRAALPSLVSELGIETILDVPCGDYHWIKEVDWHSDVTYIGGDIVSDLIYRNRTDFESSSVRFIELDLIRDTLPSADLLLCRGCLIHFSIDDIWRTLQNFVASEVPLILTTTYPGEGATIDIPTGHCRAINLQASPFGLAPPVAVIEDPGDGRPDKILALWSRQQIQERLDDL